MVRLTIGKKIVALLLLMMLAAVTNILVIYHYQSMQKYDSRIVNMAGRQRMLSQKISKLALSVANGNDSDRPLLSEAIMLYDSSLRILLHGGRMEENIIPPAPGIMKNLFEENNGIWDLFKENANIIEKESRDNPMFSEAISFVEANDELLLERSNDVVNAYESLPNAKEFAHEINVAGRQRMLSQKISKYDHMIAIMGDVETRKKLQTVMELYGKSLLILRDGGISIPWGKEIKVPPSAVKEALGPLEDLWKEFKLKLNVIQKTSRDNRIFRKAIDSIRQNNDELLRASDEVTGMFGRIFSKKVSRLRMLLFFLLGFDIFIFLIGCIMATNLTRPIRNLSKLAKRIGAGDFSQKIVIPSSKDEVRDLANAFDKMTDDLEALRERQAQLMYTGRLTSLGEMAGNVAHEIGNPLSSMSALIQILDSDKISKEEQVSYLSLLKQLVNRIDRTLRRLVTFSRPSPAKLELLDLKQVIEEAVRITTPDARFKKIIIDRRWAQDLPDIRGDHDQLIQVFVNLLLNAADEVSADGRITIETKYNRESEGVMILFSDNGHGIPPEALSKVFDPFYTTKAPGKGTGLGLSICRSIIEELRGKIEVESEVEKGATFTLTLPIGAKTNLTKQVLVNRHE